MAHDISYSDVVRNLMMDEIDTVIGASGFLRIYDATGGVPATADTAITTQVLLAELALSATAFGASSNGVITANAISDDTSANATGTAAFFRLVTSGGVSKVQGTVGTSATDLILNTVSITAGDTVSVTNFTITEGNQ